MSTKSPEMTIEYEEIKSPENEKILDEVFDFLFTKALKELETNQRKEAT